MNNELSIWTKKILILLGISGLLYVLFLLKGLVMILIIAGFITLITNPLVSKGESYRIPAWLTVISVYVIVIILGSIVIGTIIPIVASYISDTTKEIIQLANTAQSTYEKEGIDGFHFHPYVVRAIEFTLGEGKIEHTLDIIKQNAGNIQTFLTDQISSLTTGGISFVSTVGGVVAEWFLIGITAFFMILERREIGKFIIEITPNTFEGYLRNHYIKAEQVCNSWIKATLILCVSIFVTTYIGLIIVEWVFGFSTDRVFTLALISGIMEIIPYIGPILALLPALIIGLGISWKAALALTILYLAIQQLENNVLVPYVMSKNLNLSPFLVFIVMLVGASLGGILGIILAIPVAGIARVIYIEYIKNRVTGEMNESPLTESIPKTKPGKPHKILTNS